ncbi:MAG: hypothetical protein JWO86_4108 [Myxococcaceae bacterium]|nr:hypothetical protein [Myxococcaceae bacterium]
MRHAFVVVSLLVMLLSCSSGPTPAAPPVCDQLCLDGIATRGLRETMKQIFNFTFQGKDVGMHDYSIPCPLGGKARIFGTATSNAVQGAIEVDITFELDACVLLSRDTDAKQNYDLASTGTIHEKGIISVQPTATTALGIQSDSVTIEGTVYDPPVSYDAAACPLVLSQDGNTLSGMICGRTTTISL